MDDKVPNHGMRHPPTRDVCGDFYPYPLKDLKIARSTLIDDLYFSSGGGRLVHRIREVTGILPNRQGRFIWNEMFPDYSNYCEQSASLLPKSNTTSGKETNWEKNVSSSSTSKTVHLDGLQIANLSQENEQDDGGTNLSKTYSGGTMMVDKVSEQTTEAKKHFDGILGDNFVDNEMVQTKSTDVGNIGTKHNIETIVVKNIDAKAKSTDDKIAKAKSIDDRTAKAKSKDDRTAKAKSKDDRTAKAKSSDDKTEKAKSKDDRTAKSKSIDDRTAKAKNIDDRTVKAKNIDVGTINAKSKDDRTIEPKTTGVGTIGIKSIDDKTIISIKVEHTGDGTLRAKSHSDGTVMDKRHSETLMDEKHSNRSFIIDRNSDGIDSGSLNPRKRKDVSSVSPKAKKRKCDVSVDDVIEIHSDSDISCEVIEDSVTDVKPVVTDVKPVITDVKPVTIVAFKCDFCDFISENKMSVVNHLNTTPHHSASLYKCISNNDQLTPKYFLKEKAIVNESAKFLSIVAVCFFCSCVFKDIHTCAKHAVKVHNKKKNIYSLGVVRKLQTVVISQPKECFDGSFFTAPKKMKRYQMKKLDKKDKSYERPEPSDIVFCFCTLCSFTTNNIIATKNHMLSHFNSVKIKTTEFKLLFIVKPSEKLKILPCKKKPKTPKWKKQKTDV